MRDKLFYRGLPHPLNRRIHSKAPKNISKLTRQQFERTGIELKNILRWEDDGGQINQASSASIIRPLMLN
jgi:hypothetical protein